MGELILERMRVMSHKEFVKHINVLSSSIEKFLSEQKQKVDFIVPILRSGAVPAVYLANKLNIVKFLPFQVKHITRKNGSENIEIIFNPLNNLKFNKNNPVFLIVEGTHDTGTSVEMCVDEILKRFNTAKILYVCISKTYGSKSLKDKVVFEKAAYIKGNNLTVKECKKLGIDPYIAVYPWETKKGEIEHPDDLEENIYF